MTSFSEDICITFFNNHHEAIESLGGPHVLTRDQQRIYNRGEELFNELMQSVKDM